MELFVSCNRFQSLDSVLFWFFDLVQIIYFCSLDSGNGFDEGFLEELEILDEFVGREGRRAASLDEPLNELEGTEIGQLGQGFWW